MADLSPAEKIELARNLRALDAHPGWRWLAQEMARREDIEVNRVIRGVLNHEEYGRASGVLYTLRGLAKLPAEMASALNPPEEE